MTHESTEVAPHTADETSGTVFLPAAKGHLRERMPESNLSAASAFGSVNRVWHSTAFVVASNLLLLLAVVFWLGLAYWVYRDARRRVEDSWIVTTATLLALVVPFVGPLVYMLLRAPETLGDVRERELALRALEESLGRNRLRCPVCLADADERFLVCPVCTTQLKQRCQSCSAALETTWLSCPYCATPVGFEPELVALDLDAALTAEVAASTNGNGTKPQRAKRSRATQA